MKKYEKTLLSLSFSFFALFGKVGNIREEFSIHGLKVSRELGPIASTLGNSEICESREGQDQRHSFVERKREERKREIERRDCSLGEKQSV